MRLLCLIALSTLSGVAVAEPYDYALTLCLAANQAFTAVAKANGFRTGVLDTSEAREQYLHYLDDHYNEAMELRGESSPQLQAVLLGAYTHGLHMVPHLDPKTAWFSAGSDVGNFCLFQLGELQGAGRLGQIMIRVLPK